MAIKSDDAVHRVSSPMDDAGEKQVYRDGDEALDFLRNRSVDDDEEALAIDQKKLLRKIDWMVVPLMFCCYFAQYLDKSLLNYAAVMGILDDANLTTQQFGDLTLLFYVAFLAFELPHAYLMQHFPTAKYLGTMVCCWGTVVACTSACSSFASLAAVRFLLGMFESAISPSLILVTSMWFKRDEQPARVGLWYIGVGCASIFGALMSYGFQFYVGHETFRSWQIMFLIVGILTIVIGANVIIFMPDNPMTARRLTRSERIAAIERVRENQTGIENKHLKWYQVRQCFTDPQTWLLSFITIAASVPNGAVGGFQSILLSGFGFSNKVSALLQIPSGVIAVLSVLAATWSAAKYNIRGLNIIFWSLMGGILGGSLLAFAPTTSAKLGGNYLTHVVGAFLPCAYSYAAANHGGTTKRVTINAVVLMSFCLGNIIGPLTFRNKDAPDYVPAKITIVAVDSAAILGAVALLMYYRWQNKKRDKAAEGVQHKQDIEFADLTDRENPEFRYKY